MKWYEIKARAATDDRKAAAEIFIYGDIGESWWDETVSASNFVGEINALDVDEITIRLNSYGGSVVDGIAIYNAIKRHRASVTVCVDGVALSIASLIAMAGNTVEMAENATMMIHAPWGMVVGNSAELREEADVLDKFASAMATSYANKTGMDTAAVMALLTDGKDHWYTAAEAMEAGFCDQITPALAVAASANRFTQAAKPKALQPVNLPAAAAALPVSKGQNMPEIIPTPAAPQDVAAIQASIRATNAALIETGRAFAKFGGEALAMQAVSEGWTHDQLNAKLLAAASAGPAHAAYGQGARVEDNIDPKTNGFKSMGEFSYHVRAAALGNGRLDTRLQAAATTYGNESSGPDGGFSVPEQFASDIYSTALEEQSLLAMADDTPVTGNSMTFPKDETTPWGSTGITATWDGEGDTASQKKPVLGKSRLELHKLRVLVPATDELLADSAAMSAHLSKKMGEAVLWKSNDAIINGTGAGMPLGILAAASLVAQAKETSQTADTINATNVAKMYGRCIKGAGANLVWLLNPDAYAQLIVMTIGDQPIFTAPTQGMRNAPDGLLMGRPVMLTDACDTVGDQGDIILANMAGYRSITKAGGPAFSQSMHLWFDQDIQAFKLVFRMDGQPALESAVTPPNSAVTRSHFVALAARA
ncbi:MAG: phage major capsid protein [Deltaproteobacteria bacterium]|nr:phage major capsid protein [Thiobacillus sp.]MDP3213515.1 phage major capsid protein [Deltaproteobacteria bacterium]